MAGVQVGRTGGGGGASRRALVSIGRRHERGKPSVHTSTPALTRRSCQMVGVKGEARSSPHPRRLSSPGPGTSRRRRAGPEECGEGRGDEGRGEHDGTEYVRVSPGRRRGGALAS